MWIATFLGWGSNFAVSLAFPVLLAALGVGWLFSIYTLTCFAAFFFAWFLVPETKGRSLEEIEADLHGQTSAI